MTDRSRSSVLRLAGCMALNQTALSLIMTVAALSGRMLAGDQPQLATLPLAIMFVAMMAATIPASLLMGRFGRKTGFISGATAGVLAGLAGAIALWEGHFWLLVAALGLYGVAAGHANYYRFAAVEVSSHAYKSRAISYVLAGGVVAAIAGPFLASQGKELLAPFTFAGSYLIIACLSVAILPIVATVRFHAPAAPAATAASEGEDSPARPLGQIMGQPKFIVAVMAGMVGYGSMNLLMVSTPLAMDGCGFAFADAASVIQWHVLGMYLPSFFTGHLIRRFGVLRIIGVGAVVTMLAAAVNLHGVTFAHFVTALILLGVGWNFLFVGGTTLLTETYRQNERAKTQAANDFLVFGTTATTALSSGLIFSSGGWDWLNVGVLPALALVLAAVFWLALKRPQAAAATT